MRFTEVTHSSIIAEISDPDEVAAVALKQGVSTVPNSMPDKRRSEAFVGDRER